MQNTNDNGLPINPMGDLTPCAKLFKAYALYIYKFIIVSASGVVSLQYFDNACKDHKMDS